MDTQDIVKGYITIIVFPKQGYEVINRFPGNPEVPATELTPLLIAWARGHAPLIQKATGYRLEYWMDETLHYQWYAGDDLLEESGTEPVVEPVDESEEARIARLKEERAEIVKNIVVEVDGMKFNGDEISQDRMSRTITAALTSGYTMNDTTTWILWDNTKAQVSIAQLAKALLLSGQEQTEVWPTPYDKSK